MREMRHLQEGTPSAADRRRILSGEPASKPPAPGRRGAACACAAWAEAPTEIESPSRLAPEVTKHTCKIPAEDQAHSPAGSGSMTGCSV